MIHPGAVDIRAVELPAELDSISRLWDWLEVELGRLGLDATRRDAIRLCAEEVSTNIVRHAFPGGGANGGFRVRLQGGSPLVLTFEDEGIAFDPTTYQVVPTAAKAEDLDIGGVGIRLVRGFAQAMRYCRIDGTNQLTLAFATDADR